MVLHNFRVCVGMQQFRALDPSLQGVKFYASYFTLILRKVNWSLFFAYVQGL